MSNWKKQHVSPGNHRGIRKSEEVMQTETANLTQYREVAFRLLSLQKVENDGSRDSKSSSEAAHVCPRELRTMAASENALFVRQKRLLLQKSNALMKRKRNAKTIKRHSPLSQSTNDSELLPEDDLSLFDSFDAMGFLAKELTEVNDAIERNKTSLQRKTLKGLRKVISGVLHTLRQDQLKCTFDLMDLSNKMKYENITQAVPLSPRVLNRADKREPISKSPHICKGCKDGGLLPWLYLYPDHEVYRTGGGFDCVDFHLPVVNSEKPLTKPKDPFGKNRGKLTDTSMHRLPDRLPPQLTKPTPFKFNRSKVSLEVRLEMPNSEMRDFSPVSRIKFDNRCQEFGNVSFDTKAQQDFDRETCLDDKDPLNSSIETTVTDREKETGVDTKRQKTLISLENDSGVATSASSSSEIRSLEENDQASNKKDTERPAKLDKLNYLRKRVTGYEDINPLKSPKQNHDSELPKGPKKLVVRRSMSIVPSASDIRSIHNSSLLSNADSTSSSANNAFGVRRKQPLKPVGYRKRVLTMDGSEHVAKDQSSTTTVSDMSVNFSSSLSLGTSQQDILDEYSDFTLTGSKVVGMKRHSKDIQRRKPSRSNNSNDRLSKMLNDVTPIEEETPRQRNWSQQKLNRKKSKQDSFKEARKVGTTEVFVDIISSMSQRVDTPESETSDSETLSRLSSCKALQTFDEQLRVLEGGDAAKDDSGNDDFGGEGSDLTMAERSLTDELPDLESSKMDVEVDSNNAESYESNAEESEGIDGVDQLPEDGEPLGKRIRKRLKRRTALKFRNEPLSKYSLKRRQRSETESYQEMEEDISMLDYAARYCIISLERLAKYEHVFSSYAVCNGEDKDKHNSNENAFETGVVGETEEQTKMLKEYEKLIYSMDVYQQKISEAERKRTELKSEKELTTSNIKDMQLDEEKKKLLEKSVQAFSKKITTTDDRIKQFVDNVKNMMGKKRNIEEKLRELCMDNEIVDNLIKNSDFLGRKFAKLKCLEINVEDLPEALKSFNPNFDDEDFQFINHVLKLPQKDSLDFKAFAVVSALTERVKSLDKSIKALLKEVDLGTLERKLDKCKELYRLLSEEHHDGNRTIPLENLLVELQAGGLDRDHQRSVVDKLNHHGHGFVDFLDFVLYIPLFLMIHDQIVRKPFE